MNNEKIKLHTDLAGSAQGCHEIDISQKTGLAVCNKGNLPALCRQHNYYTAKGSICKLGILTNFGAHFCEKAYKVEFLNGGARIFVAFPDGHPCRRAAEDRKPSNSAGKWCRTARKVP